MCLFVAVTALSVVPVQFVFLQQSNVINSSISLLIFNHVLQKLTHTPA